MRRIILSLLLSVILMLSICMTSCTMLYIVDELDDIEKESAIDTEILQQDEPNQDALHEAAPGYITQKEKYEEFQKDSINANLQQEHEENISEDTSGNELSEDTLKQDVDDILENIGLEKNGDIKNYDFEVHFINVGQADASLVICDGKAMLIDGGNKADSDIMYTYLKSFGIEYLDYVIATHAHEDHVGGIAGALNFADCGTVYCPVTAYDSEAFEDFSKQVSKKNSYIQIPSVGTAFRLGSSEVTVLSCNASEDINDSSIVLKVAYGKTSFLFTGDAERGAEEFILNSGADISATVLKVGHHGSETSTSYPFLREVMPKYAVVSVGKDNSYGHPSDVVLSRLKDAEAEIYRTDFLGDIICRSDGENVTFEFPGKATSSVEEKLQSNDSPEVGNIEEDASDSASSDEPAYILNINSNKFHYPSCESSKSIKEKNKKEYFGTREDAVNDGYSPCGICKP